MYLLSKQIIEKNAQSISMTKILGFTNGEIGGLYIVATSIVVVLSLLIAIPITDKILQFMFTSYLYTEMTGYIPYAISNSCYIQMFVLGILSYGVVAILQLYKIKKIPKSDALKNVE
jgi:putative ABC transport system permease protein